MRLRNLNSRQAYLITRFTFDIKKQFKYSKTIHRKLSLSYNVLLAPLPLASVHIPITSSCSPQLLTIHNFLNSILASPCRPSTPGSNQEIPPG